MKLCGWKTRAMFDRYNIIDEQEDGLPRRGETVDPILRRAQRPAFL